MMESLSADPRQLLLMHAGMRRYVTAQDKTPSTTPAYLCFFFCVFPSTTCPCLGSHRCRQRLCSSSIPPFLSLHPSFPLSDLPPPPPSLPLPPPAPVHTPSFPPSLSPPTRSLSLLPLSFPFSPLVPSFPYRLGTGRRERRHPSPPVGPGGSGPAPVLRPGPEPGAGGPGAGGTRGLRPNGGGSRRRRRGVCGGLGRRPAGARRSRVTEAWVGLGPRFRRSARAISKLSFQAFHVRFPGESCCCGSPLPASVYTRGLQAPFTRSVYRHGLRALYTGTVHARG